MKLIFSQLLSLKYKVNIDSLALFKYRKKNFQFNKEDFKLNSIFSTVRKYIDVLKIAKQNPR